MQKQKKNDQKDEQRGWSVSFTAQMSSHLHLPGLADAVFGLAAAGLVAAEASAGGIHPVTMAATPVMTLLYAKRRK
ncbi:hypothetical protein [Streptomyces antimycoticus]|uniref:hypothetical protein n=1 Tax=Streptomyces antimycoticus TaxID=68175 RepID=UPI0036793BF0